MHGTPVEVDTKSWLVASECIIMLLLCHKLTMEPDLEIVSWLRARAC